MDVLQPLREPVEHRAVDDLAGALDRLAGAFHQLVPGPVVHGDADDGAVQEAARLQPVQRPERHHPREIAGDPEDHQHVRRALIGPLRPAAVRVGRTFRRCHRGFSSVARGGPAPWLPGDTRDRQGVLPGPDDPACGRRGDPLVWVRTRTPRPGDDPVDARHVRETRVTRLHKGTGMADDQHYDVVIIGTGAGGGTLGHRLATSGLKVLWLERGPFLPRERDNWETQAVFVRGKYLAPEVWYDGHGREFQPEVNYYVGGNTKFYGAALFRLRPEDFGELRHEGGISPAWPISYDELEPYYTQAEHLYLVHGQHGEDPSEGPRARSTPSAGVPRTPDPAAERRPGEARAPPVPPADRSQPPGGGAGPAHPGQCLHPLRPGRRLPVPAERQVGRAGHLCRSGPVPGQRHPRDRRPRAAPRDGRLRAHGHGRRHDAGRRVRAPPSPATWWSSPAGR